MKKSKTALTFSLLTTIFVAWCLPVGVDAQCIEQQLYSFGLPGPANPGAPVIQGSDGALYGTTALGGTNNYGTVFRLSTNGRGYQVLYRFTGTGGDGAEPDAGLIQGSDGALYGTTTYGGANGGGTVFKLSTNGGGYQVLYNFGGTSGDGAGPEAGLIQGSDGMLYGTTSTGGINRYGTVFKLSTNGGGYQVLYNFGGTSGDGAYPEAGLIQGSDGMLYGMTTDGGVNGVGTVFKLSTSGGGYQVLYNFGGTSGDGVYPEAGLIQGSDGALYGTTGGGGTSNFGTVFKLSTGGGGYQVLYSFTDTGGDGAGPEAGLIQGSNGALYGTTTYGGTSESGTVFKLSNNGGGYQVIYSFTGTGGGGAYPEAGLIQGSDGALYGTTTYYGYTYYGGTSGYGTVFMLSNNGGGFQVLCSFTGTREDGAEPKAGLIQGSDGALYGTTTYGGTSYFGTVFKLSTNGGGYQVLYSFTGTGGDGGDPEAGLIQGSDGALYGTTTDGGANGVGTVFKLNINGGGYQVLYSFTGSFTGTDGDGAIPYAGLIQGSDGALYGTTTDGGANGGGTVFKLSINGGGYQVLYSFTGTGGDGAEPEAGLIQGSDGALYGTTTYGGTSKSGTVFKLSINGDGYQVLYGFTGTGGDGAEPEAGLIQGSDGALYGTTTYGGTNGNGTLFKLSPTGGGYQVLYSFTGTNGDGASPQAGLMQGSDGPLYGTTRGGGSPNSSGTAFRIGTNGAGYSVLSRFTGTGGDGAEPEAALIQGSDGALYGTTYYGGAGQGTCFRLVPLAVPPSSQIILNGTNPVLSVTSVMTEGAPPESYTWFLNGVVLIGQTNSMLTLDGIQAPLQGNYTVIVSNSLGWDTYVMPKLSITAANRYYYDRNDRLIGAEYGNGISIAYIYDGNGNLVRQTYLSRAYETNGLPVLWRFLNGLSPTNNSGTNGTYGDADGNGWSNYEKWQLGLNPLDPTSVPNLNGLPGTNLGALSLPFTPSNFVAAVGQLDAYGGPTIVVGADGNPGTNVNSLELFSETGNGWSTQHVSIGPFGITSIAVGQPTNRPGPCIYLGLRQAGSNGLVAELQNSPGGWQMSTVATSISNAAFVLGVRPGYDVMASMAATNSPSGTLYSLLFPTNQWVARLFDTNTSSRGLGAVLLDGSYSPGTLRLLDAGGVQIGAGASTNSLGQLLSEPVLPASDFGGERFSYLTYNWSGPGLTFGIPRGTNNGATSIYYALADVERITLMGCLPCLPDTNYDFILAEYELSGTNLIATNVFSVSRPSGVETYGLASANYLNTTNEVLFTGEPDGNVYSWIPTNGTGPLQPQLFSGQYAGTLWHALERVPTLEPGQGLAGLNVNPTNPSVCNVIFWPPQSTLYSPPIIPQTAVAVSILPETNSVGPLIDIPITLNDTMGNPCSVSLMYSTDDATWASATMSQVDGLPYNSGARIAAWPNGSGHLLEWNAQADLGLVSTNVWLLVQAQDVTGSQGSATVMYQVDTVPLQITTGQTNLYLGTNGFHFTVSGLQGLPYPAIIEASTDLVNWIPIFTNQSSSNSVPFVDNSATNFRARFYRLITQ